MIVVNKQPMKQKASQDHCYNRDAQGNCPPWGVHCLGCRYKPGDISQDAVNKEDVWKEFDAIYPNLATYVLGVGYCDVTQRIKAFIREHFIPKKEARQFAEKAGDLHVYESANGILHYDFDEINKLLDDFIKKVKGGEK